MKPGKVAQTVYRRSILKQLHMDKDILLFAPSREESCYGIQEQPEEQVLVSSASLYGSEKDLCVFAMAKTANELATRGARPCGYSIQILLPDFAYESRLKMMIALAEETALQYGMQILQADAQVVPGIQTTVVSVTCLGCVKKDKLVRCNMARPEQDLVMIGHAGLEGALRVKRAREEELKGRFLPAFLDKMEERRQEIFAVEPIRRAMETGVSAMCQVGEGGILASLWELAESSDMGLTVDMRKIPVRQETIEVCEYFHLNPYQMTSTGSILMVIEHGKELADTLKAYGTEAVVIGYTTKGKERVLMNGGEKRYLDRPAPDELACFFESGGWKKELC